MTENEIWLLNHLDEQPDKFRLGLPAKAGSSEQEIEEALCSLKDKALVWFDGPPNQNRIAGRDPDEISLLPRGVETVRRLFGTKR